MLYQAQELGAVAAVVSEKLAEKLDETKFSLPYLLVKNTFSAYETLARLNREAYQGKILAVTGSVGKTTTKEMIKTLLSEFSLVYFSPNKLNNYRGLIHNLAQCNPWVDYSVYEFGMAKIGSIANKSLLAKPHIAIITDIQLDHLKHHKNIKSIARTKAEIFQGMNRHGTAVLNHDNEFFDYLCEKAHNNGIHKIVSFGRSPLATIQLIDMQMDSHGSQVKIKIKEQEFSYHLSVLGTSSVYNSLAAFAAIYALELPLALYIKGLQSFTAPEQRGELFKMNIQGKPIWVIDQRYNSNLASLKACAENLILLGQAGEADKKPEIKRKTTFIVGDMEQLGSFAKELHLQAATYLAASKIDQILYFGEYKQEFNQCFQGKNNFYSFESPKQLFNYFLKHLQKDEIMTIKGSWSHDEFDNIIKKLRKLESH